MSLLSPREGGSVFLELLGDKPPMESSCLGTHSAAEGQGHPQGGQTRAAANTTHLQRKAELSWLCKRLRGDAIIQAAIMKLQQAVVSCVLWALQSHQLNLQEGLKGIKIYMQYRFSPVY